MEERPDLLEAVELAVGVGSLVTDDGAIDDVFNVAGDACVVCALTAKTPGVEGVIRSRPVPRAVWWLRAKISSVLRTLLSRSKSCGFSKVAGSARVVWMSFLAAMSSVDVTKASVTL